MEGEVDASDPDDTVSKYKEILVVSLFFTTKSSDAGGVVLLGVEGSGKGLGSSWKGRSIFMCRSLNLPAEFSFLTLNTCISGMGCHPFTPK